MESVIEPRLLDLKQAAVYLGTKVRTVRGLVWDGEVPRIKLGKKFMLDRADLDKWIERSKRTAVQ